jgi:hypothetical protein
VDTLRPYFQPSQALLRMDKDLQLVGTQKGHPIEALISRQRSRGRPSHSGRPHYKYRVRFEDLDHAYDVLWLTKRVLRERYPDVAPKLIEECDA